MHLYILKRNLVNNRNICIPVNPSFAVVLGSCLNVQSTRSQLEHVKATKAVKIYFIIRKIEISSSTWPVVRTSVFESALISQMETKLSGGNGTFQAFE